MLDVYEVGRLKAQWVAVGAGPCDHVEHVPEVFRGEPTGMVACVACGSFWRPGGARPAR